jgi:hypothetical protein
MSSNERPNTITCWFSTLDLCSGYWQVECEGEDGVITSLFNIPFTCLSISFAKTSGSLRGGCFIGCTDPVEILCFTTLVHP